MTEQERAEWRARLEAAVAATIRRRQERRRIREQHQAARDVGLAYRNRARLARARTGGNVSDDQDQRPPCCRESSDPEGCEQHRQQAQVLGHRGIRQRGTARGSAVIGDSGKATPAPVDPTAV